MNEQPQDHMVDGSIKIEPSSTKGSLRLKHDPDGSNRTVPLHSKKLWNKQLSKIIDE